VPRGGVLLIANSSVPRGGYLPPQGVRDGNFQVLEYGNGNVRIAGSCELATRDSPAHNPDAPRLLFPGLTNGGKLCHRLSEDGPLN